MTKLTDTQKLELLREIMGNADFDGWGETIESELLNKIYRIVHPDEDCPHLNWEAETVEMYEKMLCLVKEKND